MEVYRSEESLSARVEALEKTFQEWRVKISDSILLGSLVKIQEEEEDRENLLKTVERVTTKGVKSNLEKLEIKFDGYKHESSIKLAFLEKNSEIVEGKIDDLRAKQSDIAYNLKIISEVFHQKADVTELNKVHKQMSHYAPLHEFRDLQQQLVMDYARNDEFEICQKNVSELRDITDNKIDTKTAQDKFKNLEFQFSQKLIAYAKNQYLDEQLTTLREEMKEVLDKVLLASDDLKTMKSFSEMFSTKLKVKIEYSDLKEGLDSIKSQFGNFCSYEHIKNMNAKIDPFMKQVDTLLTTYTDDNKKAKEMIRRFDEVLLEKASKFNLEELKIELKKYIHSKSFQEFLSQLSSDQAKAHKEIEQLNQKVENIEKGYSKKIDQKMECSLKDVKKKVFETIGGKPITANELDNLLKLKADKKDADFLWKSKASRQEIQDHSKSIEQLKYQLEEALVLMIQSIKNGIIWHSESKNSVINQSASNLQQLSNLYNFVKNRNKESGLGTLDLNRTHTRSIHTNRSVLPEPAVKLIENRRTSQHSRVLNNSSLDVPQIKRSEMISRNKLISAISKKKRVNLKCFNFNEAFSKFSSVQLSGFTRSRQSVSKALKSSKNS
ncbi:unnamed protein product [Moneuplotes crassus]|uniref:Uncharacterized protein n=1 Tax=Euplotes crassus TaxID=5936 RepID=A0AAD1U737_EUPCR|nr:unnamed protein product [Moneuplotes crassus]